jgi:hypothetical protein
MKCSDAYLYPSGMKHVGSEVVVCFLWFTVHLIFLVDRNLGGYDRLDMQLGLGDE